MNADAAVVADQVREYLERHPLAADTCEGIACWWLPSGPWIRRQVLQEALDWLVAAGVLKARRLPSGEVLYSAAHHGG